jgi:hypothetical protein
MKELKAAFPLGKSINKMQDEIRAAGKAIAAAAAATSNVGNTSITSSATAVDSSRSHLIIANEIIVSSESTPPLSSLSSTSSLPSSNDKTRASLDIIRSSDQSSLSFSEFCQQNHCQF